MKRVFATRMSIDSYLRQKMWIRNAKLSILMNQGMGSIRKAEIPGDQNGKEPNPVTENEKQVESQTRRQKIAERYKGVDPSILEVIPAEIDESMQMPFLNFCLILFYGKPANGGFFQQKKA